MTHKKFWNARKTGFLQVTKRNNITLIENRKTLRLDCSFVVTQPT